MHMKTAPRRLSVSIVLYQTPIEQLKNCLSSLQHIAPAPALFLIDNSPNDCLRSASELHPGSTYIHLPNNPGYGAGHNAAIKQAQLADFDYHLVINADVSFENDVICPMIKYMDENQHVAHMMPKVLNLDGSVQRLCKLLPRPSDLFIRRFLPQSIKTKNNAVFELHGSGYDRIMFVPYLSGCFMLLRHSALRHVGLFDERFFMYPEDIDLTRRLAVHYDTLFYPHASVYHEHGAASYKSGRMMWIHIINLVRYFNKWGWMKDSVRDDLNAKTLDLLKRSIVSRP
jgi:GT2 family glycosyltransferase